MQTLRRDGTTLAFQDKSEKLPPLVLIHGCGLDHSSLRAQAEFFGVSHRVISVDLRGHGGSDAPHQDYTMAGFADDLAWLCAELAVVKPLVVGHSMGGNVALEMAARHPDLPASIVMIDSPLLAPRAILDTLLPDLAKIAAADDYLGTYGSMLTAMCLPSDKHTASVISSLCIERHVLLSALENHTTRYDAAFAASACRVPVAYLHSTMPLLDLARFQTLSPQLMSASTLGSGHFSPVEVPDQINAMISRWSIVSSTSAAGSKGI